MTIPQLTQPKTITVIPGTLHGWQIVARQMRANGCRCSQPRAGYLPGYGARCTICYKGSKHE